MARRISVAVFGGFVAGTFAVHSTHADVLSNVPEAAGYTVAYDLNIPDGAAFNFNGIPYSAPLPPSVTYGSFSRVGYYLELDAGKYVYASFDAKGFTADPTKIGVPNRPSGGAFQQPVQNMNVASNVGGIVTGTAIGTGNVEFWPNDYGQPNAKGIPNADPNPNNTTPAVFDFGDSRSNNGDHGSMQIHNYGASQTIFAYNNWGNNAGGHSALGIGNDPNTARANYNPDWTFADNTNTIGTRHLQIVVGGPAQPAADPAPANLVANAPELSGYKLIYKKSIAAGSNLNTASGAGYDIDRSTGPNVAPGSFDRVAYYLELKKPGSDTTQFVEVSFKASDLSTDPQKLGIPTWASGEFYQKNVSDMNVTSNVSGVTLGTHLSGGNIEFWPSNYDPSNPNAVANADGSHFDQGDGNSGINVGYGSMQIHNHDAGQVILAYNAWSGGTGDIGIGNNTLVNGNTNQVEPDYTFSNNVGDYEVKNIYVLVNAVPEPTSLAFFALGGMLVARRRR